MCWKCGVHKKNPSRLLFAMLTIDRCDLSEMTHCNRNAILFIRHAFHTTIYIFVCTVQLTNLWFSLFQYVLTMLCSRITTYVMYTHVMRSCTVYQVSPAVSLRKRAVNVKITTSYTKVNVSHRSAATSAFMKMSHTKYVFQTEKCISYSMI